MDGSKTKTESSLTTAQAVKLRARQLTAVAGDKFKVASASLSRGDTQVSIQEKVGTSAVGKGKRLICCFLYPWCFCGFRLSAKRAHVPCTVGASRTTPAQLQRLAGQSRSQTS